MDTVSKGARKEIVHALSARYEQALKMEKGRILNEFVSVSGYHRKHAIRLLNIREMTSPRAAGISLRIYDEAVRTALLVIWEAADRICGKRLKAAIPTIIPAMERHGHLSLEPDLRRRIFSVSAATIDRILRPVRQKAGTRRKRRQAKKAAKDISIKTFSDWKDPDPGFTEIDFVVHGGGSMAGEYLHTLVVTDVCSGWVEGVALLAREQSLVIEGLKRVQKLMPIALRGIDSDNDGAFINDSVSVFCSHEGIVFTRSRPYRKNDQAWIEQKNGAVIRKMVGHERFSGIVAGQALAQLLQTVRLYVNFFQPSFKLRERLREGSKIKKTYYAPSTPCDRLLAHDKVSEEVKRSLLIQRDKLDPVELLHRIRQCQGALAALSTGDPSSGPDRQSLDQFLAGLPQLWRMGEVRPTHRKDEAKTRDWRTRTDPFTNAWTDILFWLQSNPDSTAKSLLDRLNEKYPDQYGERHLRTLQRRIGEWRKTMARKLVFEGIDHVHDAEVVGLGARSGETTLQLATLASASFPLNGQNSLKNPILGNDQVG